jgi:TolB protein
MQCPTAGPDRLIVFIDGNLYSMTEYGSRMRALTAAPQNFHSSISPDGWRIAFTSNRDGNNEIYVMNADGTNQENLTRSPATREWWPRWSPDGTKIIFYSWNTEVGPTSGEIYVMDSGGTGPWTALTANNALDADPEFSPDGQRIVFMSERDGNQEIYVMNADGSGTVRLTDAPGLDGTPRWSPDGSRIAFATSRFGAADSYDIVVMNVDGSGLVRLTDDPEIDVRPIWSPDGKRILYTHRVVPGNIDVWIMNADGSARRVVLTGAGNEQADDWGIIGGSQIRR